MVGPGSDMTRKKLRLSSPSPTFCCIYPQEGLSTWSAPAEIGSLLGTTPRPQSQAILMRLAFPDGFGSLSSVLLHRVV